MEKAVFKSDINNPQALIQEFLSSFDFYTDDEKSRISTAWEYFLNLTKDELAQTTEPVYMHPLRVAYILASNKMDCDTVIAGLLHSAIHHGGNLEEIQKKYGDICYNILAGLAKISRLSGNSKTLLQTDAIRKMLFALSDDVRIILVKMADRLDIIRHISFIPKEDQHALAQSILNIWAPMADRLGMQSEKNEFEDLSLKYTNPAVFQQIKAIVAQKKDERAAYLENAENAIYKRAEEAGIKVSISSRAKHFYSIYQKMRKRNKEASELFDLLALRIICETPAECYTLVGIVHDLWKPLDGRFKDYIAIPKSNGYQSLHTTVMCGDHPLEIQIRTAEMHNMAEHGIASHWLYKKGTNRDLVEKDKLSIFNQLQKLKDNNFADDNFFAELKDEMLGDEIYVFTPKGDVIHLPQGSTAIDFAYAIHSGVGEKICGAKADGKIIPLTQPLKNTQIIEVITNPQSHPTESQLKIAKTTKARQKIHSWLTLHNPDFVDERKIPEQREPIIAERKPKRKPKSEAPAAPQPHVENIKIGNTSNFIFSFAKCCNPRYPEPIIAYLSRTKGMTIHRMDCYVYQRIPNKEERSLIVEWADEIKDKNQRFPKS